MQPFRATFTYQQAYQFLHAVFVGANEHVCGHSLSSLLEAGGLVFVSTSDMGCVCFAGIFPLSSRHTVRSFFRCYFTLLSLHAFVYFGGNLQAHYLFPFRFHMMTSQSAFVFPSITGSTFVPWFRYFDVCTSLARGGFERNQGSVNSLRKWKAADAHTQPPQSMTWKENHQSSY